MYAYYTITTTILVFLIFASISVHNGKWYYIILHPYSLFCAGLVAYYRYALKIPAITAIADKTIALGIILTSICFWAAYAIPQKKHY